MTFSIRRRLLAITVLAAVTCTGALFAIIRLAHSSIEQRTERARSLVEREVERNAQPPPAGSPCALHVTGSSRVGSSRLPRCHGPSDRVRQAGSSRDRAALVGVVRQSRTTAGPVVTERDLERGTLVVAVAPLEQSEGYVWAATRVVTPPRSSYGGLRCSRLALITLLLVGVSLHTIIALDRSAQELRSALSGLAQDCVHPL